MSIDTNDDRIASSSVYLELSEGSSHKFYEVTVNGVEVTIRYGRIGTAGQSSNSTYATPEKAQVEATKKINEKLRKGYVRVPSRGNPPTASEQLLADPIQPSDPRHYWVYGSGWFSADGQGGWEEVNEDTRHQGQSWRFRETTRTEDYVELYDQSRWVTVRLTAMAMLVRWDRAGNDAMWEEYHKGQWQEPICDRPASESPTASEISLRSSNLAELPSNGSQEPPSAAAAAPPLPAIAWQPPPSNLLRPPTIELLNQATSGEIAATPVDRATESLLTVETENSVSFRSIDLATLPIEIESGLNVLRIPLERSLVSIEITVACDPSTVRRNASNSGNVIYPAFILNLNVGNDIAYHMGVRPLQGQVVQNTCVAGGWGLEENRPIPAEFLSDQPFTLRVALEQTVVVFLNGQVFSRFAHRLPATQMDTVRLVYPPGNLQVQSVQVVERMDGEIDTPADVPSESPTENHPLSPAIAPPSPQPPPSSLLRPPTIELLNQATSGQHPLPAIARTDLSHGKYPLGFTLRENRYCHLNIPLPRSLVCLEIVATCHRSTTSCFTFRFCVQETVTYSFDFYPHTAQLAVGQLFHLVLVLTAQQTMNVYVNNQRLPDTPQHILSEPLDKLVLGYDASAVELQMLRVFEPQGAEAPGPAINRAIALPPPVPTTVSAPDTSPETMDDPSFLRDLPAQFEPLRSLLGANLVPYIKIQAGAEVGSLDWLNGGTGDPLTVWQSKMGGNPYFPKDREYPTESDTGKVMPLLLQINCADVPPIAGFDFPQQGMLQFYLGFEPADASGTPGKYRVLYFPELSTDVQDLITDFSFLEIDYTIQDLYPEVYPITFAVSHDLFGESRPVEAMDLPEELQELGAAFDEWLGDYLHETETRIRGSKLGGYVDLHSDTDEIAESANGRLLLELVHPSCCDDSFLFFIPDDQLRDRNFSQVEFYFVCD